MLDIIVRSCSKKSPKKSAFKNVYTIFKFMISMLIKIITEIYFMLGQQEQRKYILVDNNNLYFMTLNICHRFKMHIHV